MGGKEQGTEKGSLVAQLILTILLEIILPPLLLSPLCVFSVPKNRFVCETLPV